MKLRYHTGFTTWVRTHQRFLLIVTGILLIGVAGIITAYIWLLPPIFSAVQTPQPKKPDPVYYSPLTGVKVDSEEATQRAVTAIMIENSPDARPQSGLKDSGVVFEAIAEGGITRFLVIYQQEQPQLIGPVRSLRMYYVDWVAPFDASVGHVGGSAKALQEIRNGQYRDIDQFFNGGYYWRASDRWAPHNVYTSFEKLNALNESKGYLTSSFTGFKRGDSKAAETPTATSVDVQISGFTYNSHYDYNHETNTYNRSQAGEPHMDREQGQISPRVVIVMAVEQHAVMEDGYREEIQAIGSGVAHIFQDGTVQQVTWHKPDRFQQITFTNEAGEEVPLARGQTWITAVPADRGGVTWQ